MDEEKIYSLIGKRIKFLREKQNMTQEKLAERTGLSLDYIGKIEVNINHPGLKALMKIADALSVELVEIFNFK